MADKNCVVCGSTPNERPAIFKNEDYCCDLCRKVISGEVAPKEYEEKTGRRFNPETGLYDQKSAAKLLEAIRARR